MAKNTNLDKDMEEEMEGVDDSDGSGEDEDSGEEGSLSPETLAKISELEQALESNPYNYANHEELVKLLKTGEDFDRLRKARENWSKVFPLTGQLWLEWVADEQKIAATEEEKSEVQNLLERGVRDYLSVDLWLERCMVGMQGIGTSAGAAQSRRIFEEAIAACGLHCGKGSLVWDAYREMETALVSLTAEGSEEHLKAKELVNKLWIRQLRQPLLGMESTLKEYKEWCGKDVDKGLLADYQKARQRLKKREPLESSLLNTEGPEQLEIFRQYAALEKEEGEPARVQCLYERAVAEHCLVGELWEEYLAYMESTIKIGPVVLPVYARALRNCPWSVELWCAHLRALERYEKETSEVTKVFEQALEAGFSELSSYLELWLTFIDYKRRGTRFGKEETDSMRDLRTVFERARIHLGEVGGDPGHEVAKYQANLEADQYGCMDVARQIWAAILQAQPFTASLWMDFIQLEKTYGDKKHLRKAFQRALEKTYDQPEIIAKAFLQFEREEGSLEAWEQCRKQCKARLARVDASKEKEKDKGMDEEARRADKVERKKEKDKQYRRDRRQEEAATKRENMANNGRNGVGSFKSKPLAENSKVDAPPGFKPPPDFNGKKRAGVEPPPGFKEPAPKKLKTVTDQEFNELSETKQKEMRTVFLSNLSYEVDDDRIRDTMVSSGPIVEVRLIKKPDGKSKGYAFVEFEHRDSAVAALARDNEQLDGRPMYVSEVGQNKKEGAGFKFKTELEKNKLFVRGLDPSVSQDEVRELFSQYGQLTGVRLVTYRNGHSKGIAFVEFEKEAEAAVALVKTDGIKLKGVALQVALSNPPKKEESSQNPPFSAGVAGAPQQVRSLGGTSQEPGPRGKGRSQLAFTPRVLATSSTAKGQAAIKLQPMKFVKPGGAKMEGSLGEGNGKDSTGDESKSNADFRSMFLKRMSVVIETTIGDLTVDLYLKERPKTCLNFLKLCKNKAYNCSLFHTVQPGFVAQTGDPTGKGRGGESIFAQLYGEQAKYFESEATPRIKHTRPGLVSMVNCGTIGEEGSAMLGSQFFITLGEDIEYLDAEHCVFGEVVDWEEVVEKFNGVITDREHRPYQDVRITHTVILHDPYDDPPGLEIREDSPEPTKELLAESRIGADENINDYEGMTEAEMNEVIAEKEAKARAAILTIVGDLPDEDVAPPENVLFVCKLNPVTCDDDLEIIFGRFGKVIQCEVIRDRVSGESLQYAFVEFEDREACEKAYFKMDNVLIDDRRIHVDFSQSVSRFRWKGKGRLEYVAGQKQSFKEGARPVKAEGKGEDLKEVIERERREKKREPDRRERDRKEERGKRRSRSRDRKDRSRSRDRKERRSRSRSRERKRSRDRRRSRSREGRRSRSRERKRSRSKEKRKGGSDQFGRRVRRRSRGGSSGSD